MKTRWTLLIIVVLAASLLAACAGTAPAANQPVRQINVTGTGKVYVVPDIAYIYIGVRSQADDVATALGQNNRQAQTIADTLKQQGIAAEDIQTTAFNVYPMQEYNPDGTPSKISYVVENTVFVKVRELQKLGEILNAVVEGGANTINGISFDIADRAAAEAEARRLAVEDAKAKAAELAGLAGVTLGTLQSINVYSSGGPMPVYEAKGGMAASASVPIAAGQLVIQADANLSYEIK
ncbi:MAG: SIMPL domain-containing protein [Chloroflexota bacterium]